MSTWEIPEKRSRFMWLVKAPEGAERPRVCFLCAPPPACFALAMLAAATELVWAALVGHIVGICVGAAGILIAVFTCYGATKWPAKARIRMTALCTVTTLLTIFTVLLIAVRGMGASDTRFKTFPSTCVLPDGCTRVAYPEGTAQGTHRCVLNGAECQVPRIAATQDVVRASLKDHLNSLFQTRVVTDEPHYMHAVILSLLWGFPDDFGIEIACNASTTQLFIQSEQRVGTTDSGVNEDHVTQFLSWLDDDVMAAGICSAA